MAVDASQASTTAGPIAVGVGTGEDSEPRRAVGRALHEAVAPLGGEPGLIVLASCCGYEATDVLQAARALTGGVPVIGGTSAGGFTTREGLVRPERGRGVAVMALAGSGFQAGLGAAELGRQPRRAAERAAEAAIASAGARRGSPRAAIMFVSPGHEEAILAGVVSTIGRGVPLLGWTVGDEDLSGRWAVFGGDRALLDGVAVALLYGDFLAGNGWASGYWPSSDSARAEGVSGRMVATLDGEPAGQAYSRWLGAEEGALVSSDLRNQAALHPLGVEEARSRRLLTKEPGTVSADGRLGLFADVPAGEAVKMLTATPESLIAAAGAASTEALARASLTPDLVRGALIAQGIGRVRVLGDRAGEVPTLLGRTLGGAPLLGLSGYGEQSSLPDGRPVHLNLSVSVLVLGG